MELFHKCCFCRQIKRIADIDENPVKRVTFYYCYPCLSRSKPLADRDSTQTIYRHLTKAQMAANTSGAAKLFGQTPESIILAAIDEQGVSRTGLNSAIRKLFGGYLRPSEMNAALLSLSRSGKVECRSKRYFKSVPVASVCA